LINSGIDRYQKTADRYSCFIICTILVLFNRSLVHSWFDSKLPYKIVPVLARAIERKKEFE
jgi:hypothetical protein